MTKKKTAKYQDNDSLAEARKWLSEHVEHSGPGATCPCCGKFCKDYLRPLNSGMARTLIKMYKHDSMGWMNVTRVSPGGREEGKLVYWGLLEVSRGLREDGAPKSYYRLTRLGRLFVQGVVSLPRKVWMSHDGRFLGLDGTEQGDIHDAIDSKFSYAELMNS